jgi:hypothetical protein
MAQRVTISLVDDLDGTEATETVTFGLDGGRYEIDLSDKNAAKLRKALDGYVSNARRVSGTNGARPRRVASSGPKPADVRAWAAKNKITVPDRGRIPNAVMEQYTAAQ